MGLEADRTAHAAAGGPRVLPDLHPPGRHRLPADRRRGGPDGAGVEAGAQLPRRRGDAPTGTAASRSRCPVPASAGRRCATRRTPEQRERFLQIFNDHSRARWGAMAMTEPGAGSDVARIQTRARKDGERVGADRAEDVLLELGPRRLGGRVGDGRPGAGSQRAPRLRGRAGHARLRDPQDRAQDGLARLRDGQLRPRRRPPPGRQPARRRVVLRVARAGSRRRWRRST